MKNFDIEYISDNLDERHHVNYTGYNETDVYLAFVKDHPKEYIITNITEV